MTMAMEKKVITINDNCKNRIKPKLTRDVKTEAILVFARTALERFFKQIDNEQNQPYFYDNDDSKELYKQIRELSSYLQVHVVNVEYLLDLMQKAKSHPNSQELKQLAKYEEPLITYYDAMARKMEYYFPTKTTVLPEFIVICCLSQWILEEEKPTNLYPFLDEFDFLSLIGKFEFNARLKGKEARTLLTNMYKVSIDIIDTLKRKKYKFNTQRVSKKRKR